MWVNKQLSCPPYKRISYYDVRFKQRDLSVPAPDNSAKPKPDPGSSTMSNKTNTTSETMPPRTGPLILTDLPAELLEFILKNLSYDNISKLRCVCQRFNSVCSTVLNIEFNRLRALMQQRFQGIKAQMPRRESARRKHPLARESDIIETLHMRLSLLHMTFGKHIERKHCCFFSGEILDEVYRIVKYIENTPNLSRAYKVTDELFDLSTMAMEYFKEHIEPTLPEITYFATDFLEYTPSVTSSPKTQVSLFEESITNKPSSSFINNGSETVTTPAINPVVSKSIRKLRELVKRNGSQVVSIKRSQHLSRKKTVNNQRDIQQLKLRYKEYDRKILNASRKLNAVLQDLNQCKTELQYLHSISPIAQCFCRNLSISKTLQSKKSVGTFESPSKGMKRKRMTDSAHSNTETMTRVLRSATKKKTALSNQISKMVKNLEVSDVSPITCMGIPKAVEGMVFQSPLKRCRNCILYKDGPFPNNPRNYTTSDLNDITPQSSPSKDVVNCDSNNSASQSSPLKKTINSNSNCVSEKIEISVTNTSVSQTVKSELNDCVLQSSPSNIAIKSELNDNGIPSSPLNITAESFSNNVLQSNPLNITEKSVSSSSMSESNPLNITEKSVSSTSMLESNSLNTTEKTVSDNSMCQSPLKRIKNSNSNINVLQSNPSNITKNSDSKNIVSQLNSSDKIIFNSRKGNFQITPRCCHCGCVCKKESSTEIFSKEALISNSNVSQSSSSRGIDKSTCTDYNMQTLKYSNCNYEIGSNATKRFLSCSNCAESEPNSITPSFTTSIYSNSFDSPSVVIVCDSSGTNISFDEDAPVKCSALSKKQIEPNQEISEQQMTLDHDLPFKQQALFKQSMPIEGSDSALPTSEIPKKDKQPKIFGYKPKNKKLSKSESKRYKPYGSKYNSKLHDSKSSYSHGSKSTNSLGSKPTLSHGFKSLDLKTSKTDSSHRYKCDSSHCSKSLKLKKSVSKSPRKHDSKSSGFNTCISKSLSSKPSTSKSLSSKPSTSKSLSSKPSTSKSHSNKPYSSKSVDSRTQRFLEQKSENKKIFEGFGLSTASRMDYNGGEIIMCDSDDSETSTDSYSLLRNAKGIRIKNICRGPKVDKPKKVFPDDWDDIDQFDDEFSKVLQRMISYSAHDSSRTRKKWL